MKAALNRDYDGAIEIYRTAMMIQGLNEALLSALAEAYYRLAFKYLADQVKLSISQSRGNHLLFEHQRGDGRPLPRPRGVHGARSGHGTLPRGHGRHAR